MTGLCFSLSHTQIGKKLIRSMLSFSFAAELHKLCKQLLICKQEVHLGMRYVKISHIFASH